MEKLQKQIDAFYASNEALEQRMMKLARTFLFGGYINVRGQYHIYLRTMEFYYHEEDGTEKDPIMYHRNNYHVAGEIPYFTPLSFNSHDTGVDITFENEKERIRASVLIRAYEVWDCYKECWLVWNKDPKEQQFQPYKDGLPKYNTQSMYVKKFLNGFSSTGEADITWVSVNFDEKQIPKKTKRQGIYEYEKEPYAIGKWKRKEPKEREKKDWAYKRENDIVLK